MAKSNNIEPTGKNPRGAGRTAVVLDPAGVAELAGKGLTKTQIAEFFGIHISTLLRKESEDPNLKRAMSIGRARANYAVANTLYERALAGDTTAIIWYEKTRTGRTDRLDIRVTELVETELQTFLDYLQDNLDEATYIKIELLVARYAQLSASSTETPE